jgi:hypothetical protein
LKKFPASWWVGGFWIGKMPLYGECLICFFQVFLMLEMEKSMAAVEAWK